KPQRRGAPSTEQLLRSRRQQCQPCVWRQRMNAVYIESVGVYGPGLVGWEQARTQLAGATAYAPAPPVPLKPARLAPDVRRRTTAHIRLAADGAGDATQPRG